MILFVISGLDARRRAKWRASSSHKDLTLALRRPQAASKGEGL
jgi:hypothetical protein